MRVLSKTKIGSFLVISSVLAVWALLAAQPAQAHKPDSPTCSGLPTAAGFFEANNIAAISPTPVSQDNTQEGLDPDLTTKAGTGSAAKGGNTKYRYAKITVPQLAAGELRVFDTSTTEGHASDAVLCHKTSQRARYRTSHPSSHTNAENARTSALTAAGKAGTAETAAGAAETAANTAANDGTITESNAKSALRSASSALSSASSALSSASSALSSSSGVSKALSNASSALAKAGNTAAANEAADAATTAQNAADAATTAKDAATTAKDAATTAANTNNNNDATDEKTALGTSGAEGALDTAEGALNTAEGALNTAAGALRTAANALHSATAVSKPFQLRAEVRPGDEEYILVTTLVEPTLGVRFNGAIANKAVRRAGSLNAGDQHNYSITVTAPGLLTVETTGSTDTAGMLGPTVTAMDDDSGSGSNFKMVVPVEADTTAYTLSVDGQTASTTGAYTLNMAFKVAMQTGATGITNSVTVPDAPTWEDSTGITADDTTVQIKRVPADGNKADEDYFLLTIDNNASGFLTVQTTDATGATKKSDTTGTFYGPTGQIATDSSSGAGNHFKINAPVGEGKAYVVKVTGTDGAYQLKVTIAEAEGNDLLAVPGSQAGPTDTNGDPNLDCSGNDAGEICPPSSGSPLETERYVFNIEGPGTLYVHTTGNTDTVGTVYGPDGRQLATDDNSGEGNNFRIAVRVRAGLHMVTVRGKDRHEQGVFNLVASFVSGAGPTDPTDPTDPPPATDSTGNFEDPPNESTRSGVGLIRGWVCQANRIEVQITNAEGERVVTETAAYGSSRPDVVQAQRCQHSSPNVGFGITYNFNRLPEGTYTISALADGQVIGQAHTFDVVRISDQEFPTTFTGECVVPNFPATGQTVTLEWETSTQNFQITDIQ